MNKNFLFLLAILIMLIASTVLIFYPSKLDVMNANGNITFRKEEKLSTTSSVVYEDMVSTIDRSNHRRLEVEKYRDRMRMESALNVNSVSYVSGNASLMSGSAQPRVMVSAGSPTQGYKRYVSDNSVGPNIVNVAGFQQLRIEMTGLHSHDEIVQVGGMMGAIAFDDCTHEHVDWSTDGAFGTCTDCNGQGTIIGDKNGDGTIDMDDMEWVPIGDIVVPMMLFGFIYLLLCFLRRNSFM